MSPSALNQDGDHETLLQLSAPLNTITSIDPLVQLLAITYKTTRPSPTKQDRLKTLMHTISLHQPVQPKIYSHEEQRNSFIRFLSPALSGMAGLQDFEKAVQTELAQDPEGFRAFWQLEERDLVNEMVADGLMTGASPGAEAAFLDTFVGKDGEGWRVGLGSEGTLMRVGNGREIGETVRVMRSEEDGRVVYQGRY